MHFRSRTFLTPYPHQHYFNTFYRPRPRMGGFLCVDFAQSKRFRLTFVRRLLVAGGLLGYHIGKNHSKDFEKGVPWCRENREARWQRRQVRCPA